ncbi:DUF58 domain-containing protein [Asanoa ishikariensis]|uniref:DUF58 domain-containing protein n=1 Tax=Asanoa ishikariensis TaxID=137265 RepID=A0A1H3UG80_9ACTN|nr:DUF58 domain-containing protein [Asanoa ishikariensis]GIF63664.1 DUF58 domain-containing protein [Asanoa ishikariensis]SDZ61071.1 Protein of unknown function DUF58 [Asanoa ishikariensis]
MRSAPDRLLRRLEWRVIRRLDGRLQGAYRTAFRGTGIDFDSLREYAPDDDVRHIDWNVTARLDQPHVRQYTEERELTAWLVLDQSASMRFGETPQGKDSMLTDLAVCLARLFTRGGNRVGAILYDNRAHRVVPPRTGRDHVLRLTDLVTAPTADRGGGSTDLAAMLRLAAGSARRRSLVFVVSDFIGEGDWAGELTRLALRHEVVAIRVVHPAELDLPDLGLVLVEDAETGEQLLADTGDPLFRERLRAEVEARESMVDERMVRTGVAAHRVRTDEDLVEVLVEMVRRTRRRRR